MKYCQNCVLPDTRPNLRLDQKGVCNACHSHGSRPSINWEERQLAFEKVVSHAKARSKGYDCLIPVSGGKDSTWQVVTCLEYGLNPLAVTWKTPARTALGQKNLDNLIRLGVDHIDYQISPKVEKKFMLEALIRSGDPAIPMHMALFNIPLNLAVRLEIPLVVWGENSAFEYGSLNEADTGFHLNQDWLRKYGVTHGTTAQDWLGKNLNLREMTAYFGPDDQKLEEAGVLAVFTGYYFSWDPETSLKVATQHGFQADTQGARTGYYNYADIDDEFISVHHFLKWYKFGFTRLFDNLSLEIRNNRLSRADAVEIIRKIGDDTPRKDIQSLCKFLEISEERFWEIIEPFRNLNIWERNQQTWQIKNFIIPDWSWQ
jgi:N-acetyl sugar amidotransferase